jgi:uncharacterized protein (TIGR00255 family)
MTGFARVSGTVEAARWTWEVKTVNARGLDIRLRTPPGFDALEIAARKLIGERLARGTCQANLAITRPPPPVRATINRAALDTLLRALADLSLPANIGAARLDGLLAVRGIVEIGEEEAAPGEAEALVAACDAGLGAAIDALRAMRASEGAALQPLLAARLARIGELTCSAERAPQRRPEAVKAKLLEAIAALGERHGLDPQRLHQEALLLAAKADVREELDRLVAHRTAAEALLSTGGAVGRRLDFLAQELAREATTFCAKVNDAALTAIGLELRVEIEQFREQVQNIE